MGELIAPPICLDVLTGVKAFIVLIFQVAGFHLSVKRLFNGYRREMAS